ncbi:MAG: PssD/Cps14F family polysaccharide biosynthesis glycosyltransferase [Planctomycetota bacterium]
MPKKLLLICSSGGHLLQLHSLLGPLWSDYDRSWVSFDKSDTRSLLKEEKVHWGFFPTNRNLRNLWRNWRMARKVIREEQPDVVISTGAGVAVPYLIQARRQGIRTIYIESYARRDNLSLSGKLVYRFVDHFLVQSPGLAEQYAKARYYGTIY